VSAFTVTFNKFVIVIFYFTTDSQQFFYILFFESYTHLLSLNLWLVFHFISVE